MQLTTVSRLRSFSIGLLVVIFVSPVFGQDTNPFDEHVKAATAKGALARTNASGPDTNPFDEQDKAATAKGASARTSTARTGTAAPASTQTGDDDPFFAKPAKVSRPPTLREQIETKRIDIHERAEFTVGKLVKTIRKDYPTLNIIVSKNTVSSKIPPIELSNATILSVLYAMQAATESELSFEFLEPDENVICISRDPDIGPAPEATVSVFNVEEILKNTPEESFLSAVEIGLNMQGGSGSKVEMVLHKETKLMFVKGMYRQLETVQEIVDKLAEISLGRVNGGGGFGGGGPR